MPAAAWLPFFVGLVLSAPLAGAVDVSVEAPRIAMDVGDVPDCATVGHATQGSQTPDVAPVVGAGELGVEASAHVVVAGATVILLVRPTECVPEIPPLP